MRYILPMWPNGSGQGFAFNCNQICNGGYGNGYGFGSVDGKIYGCGAQYLVERQLSDLDFNKLPWGKGQSLFYEFHGNIEQTLRISNAYR